MYDTIYITSISPTGKLKKFNGNQSAAALSLMNEKKTAATSYTYFASLLRLLRSIGYLAKLLNVLYTPDKRLKHFLRHCEYEEPVFGVFVLCFRRTMGFPIFNV